MRISEAMMIASTIETSDKKVWEAIVTLIEAAKKQETMKPIHKEKSLYCQNCDHWLLWDDAIPNEWDNYCAICGQAIDWEVDA